MGKKNSAVIGSFPVEESDDLMLISDAGQTIRVAVAGISIQGRAAQGVTVFRVDEGEKVRVGGTHRRCRRRRMSAARSASGFIPAPSIR